MPNLIANTMDFFLLEIKLNPAPNRQQISNNSPIPQTLRIWRNQIVLDSTKEEKFQSSNWLDIAKIAR